MVTDAQVRVLRQKIMEKKKQLAAAAAAGMSVRSARTWQRGALHARRRSRGHGGRGSIRSRTFGKARLCRYWRATRRAFSKQPRSSTYWSSATLVVSASASFGRCSVAFATGVRSTVRRRKCTSSSGT